MVPILIETHVALLIELAEQILTLLGVLSCGVYTNWAHFTRLTIILYHLLLYNVRKHNRIFVVDLIVVELQRKRYGLRHQIYILCRLFSIALFFLPVLAFLELLLHGLRKLPDSLVDLLHIWRYALNPACMISDHIFVLYLTNGHNFSVDTVLLEVLIDSQMYLNLLDSIHPLVKHMLHLVHLSKATFTKQLLLVE